MFARLASGIGVVKLEEKDWCDASPVLTIKQRDPSPKMLRFPNAVLLLVIVAGLIVLVVKQQAVTSMSAEHAALTEQFGELEIGDPSRFHMVRVETGDPMYFQWRFYVPAGAQLTVRRYRGRSGWSGSSSSIASEAHSSLLSCRFRVVDGELSIFTSHDGGSGLSRWNWKPKFEAELVKRWDELDIKVVGKEETIDFAPNEAVVALKISVPPELKKELAAFTSKKQLEKLDKPILVMVIGDKAGADSLERKSWPEQTFE